MIYDPYAGRLAELDGQTVTIAAFTAAYTPSPSDATLDAIDADEVSTGDAAGYERQTVGATWDAETRRLTFDDPAVFDLDGAIVQHFVVADLTGALAFPLSYDTPFDGYDGFELNPPVAASEADTAGIEARLLALETAPGPASPVPDPSEAPDGQMIVTFDGEYVLDDAPSGGGVESVVAGTGITVDDTDPAHPIISATGGGGGGGGAVGSQVFDVSSETGSSVSVDLTTMPVDKQTAVVLAPPQQHQLSFDWPDMSARGVLIVVCMPSSGAGMGATTPQIPDANNQVAVIMAFEGDGSPEAVWLNSMPNGYWEPDGQVLGTVSGMPRWVTP